MKAGPKSFLNKNKFREMMKKSLNKESSISTKWRPIPSNVKFFIPEVGICKIDIIPFRWTWEDVKVPDMVDDITWKLPYLQHPGVGSDNKSYVCLRTIGVPCPLCEYRNRLINEDAKGNEALIDDLKPRQRTLFNVIDVTSGRPADPEKHINVFDISHFLFTEKLIDHVKGIEEEIAEFKKQYTYAKTREEKEQIRRDIEEAESKFLFTFPSEGRTLKVRFTEKKFGKYSFITTSNIEFLKRPPYPDDIIEKAHKLCDLLRIFPPDLLEAIFYDSISYSEAIKEVEKIEKEMGIFEYIRKISSKTGVYKTKGRVAKDVIYKQTFNDEASIIDDARADDVDDISEEEAEIIEDDPALSGVGDYYRSEVDSDIEDEIEDREEDARNVDNIENINSTENRVRERDTLDKIEKRSDAEETEDESLLDFKRTKNVAKGSNKEADKETDKITSMEEKQENEEKDSGEEMTCPFGHKFGEDFGAKGSCASCPTDIWSKCSDAWGNG